MPLPAALLAAGRALAPVAKTVGKQVLISKALGAGGSKGNSSLSQSQNSLSSAVAPSQNSSIGQLPKS